MSTPLRAISSMATRQLLGELAAAFEQQSARALQVESVGGVDAARRVAAGEPFDLVILASDAIERLAGAGVLASGSQVPLVRSGVAAAVAAGAAAPRLDSELALREAVLGAASIGYSTGPSGNALLQLFDRWGIAAQLKDRLVQATPGVPVASLVAEGTVALGFQQLSELIHVQGIRILPLPEAVQITTIFSGAVCASSSQADAARRALEFLASPDTAAAKRRQGMEPA